MHKRKVKDSLAFDKFFCRQLLLFGHTQSNDVCFSYFTLGKRHKSLRIFMWFPDGTEVETGWISLEQRTLRGMIFMKEERPKEFNETEYQNRELELSNGPQFLILDSRGYLHQFRYFDSKCFAPAVSMFILQEQEELERKPNRTKRSRCRSLHLEKNCSQGHILIKYFSSKTKTL